MYTAKICLNSVPDDPINFILGADMTTTRQWLWLKMVAIVASVP